MKTSTRNPHDRASLRRASLLVALAFTASCFAFSPQARAVCQEGCDGTNTFLGDNALINNDVGVWNTAVGGEALFSNTSGDQNTATGYLALSSNTIGSFNTANGYLTLSSNTGDGNTAIGSTALLVNTTGAANTAVGVQALERNTTGGNNAAIGYVALRNNTTGSSNIALGEFAGSKITTGSNNIDIGNRGFLGGEDNKIRIGTPGSHMATFIAGISGETVAAGVGVIVGTDGKLGTTTSSARFKEQIKPMDKASEAILSLRPVSFRYKKELDPEGIPQFGLVAEDVAKVIPSLVARDEQGRPYSVRYEAVNAMLLNEFLKEHQKVEKQSGEIAQLQAKLQAIRVEQQKESDLLRAALQEQTAEIRKVSAELRISKTAARVVSN